MAELHDHDNGIFSNPIFDGSSYSEKDFSIESPKPTFMDWFGTTKLGGRIANARERVRSALRPNVRQFDSVDDLLDQRSMLQLARDFLRDVPTALNRLSDQVTCAMFELNRIGREMSYFNKQQQSAPSHDDTDENGDEL